jgi:hypothetical protein
MGGCGELEIGTLMAVIPGETGMDWGKWVDGSINTACVAIAPDCDEM